MSRGGNKRRWTNDEDLFIIAVRKHDSSLGWQAVTDLFNQRFPRYHAATLRDVSSRYTKPLVPNGRRRLVAIISHYFDHHWVWLYGMPAVFHYQAICDQLWPGISLPILLPAPAPPILAPAPPPPHPPPPPPAPNQGAN